MKLWREKSDSPSDVLDALALVPFAKGTHRWARTCNLERVRPDAPLMPAHGQLLRVAEEEDKGDARLVGGDDWTLLVVRYGNRSAKVTVTAVNDEVGRSVLEETVKDAVEPPPEADHVEMGFWWRGSRGGRRSERPITVSPWRQISGNYSRAARDPLGRLMDVTPTDVNGRLILLHGPPGTGKTTVLRTLAHEWRDWCQVDCVLDPERLFNDPGYLMEVAIGEDRDLDKRRWRLLVLEDCDELIRSSAKEATGQGLSRLLNLTDGLLGQGRDVLVAVTTNEDLARLHPAVIRPGRCLAQIQVGPLSFEEAEDWLGGTDGLSRSGATLAELFALRSGETAPSSAVPETTGLYL